MEKRTAYKGTLNGVYGVYCDVKPKGLRSVEEMVFYTADEGKAFYKDGEYTTAVVIDENHKIEDYMEIVLPKSDEETLEEMK